MMKQSTNKNTDPMSIDHTHSYQSYIPITKTNDKEKKNTWSHVYYILFFSGIGNYIILFDTMQRLILDLMMTVEKISR